MTQDDPWANPPEQRWSERMQDDFYDAAEMNAYLLRVRKEVEAQHAHEIIELVREVTANRKRAEAADAEIAALRAQLAARPQD